MVADLTRLLSSAAWSQLAQQLTRPPGLYPGADVFTAHVRDVRGLGALGALGDFHVLASPVVPDGTAFMSTGTSTVALVNVGPSEPRITNPATPLTPYRVPRPVRDILD